MITRTENSEDMSGGCFSLKTVSSGKRGSINHAALPANVVSELYSTNSQTYKRLMIIICFGLWPENLFESFVTNKM